MISTIHSSSPLDETNPAVETVATLPVIPANSAGGPLSHLQLMAYFQRLVYSSTHRVMVLPAPQAFARALSSSVEDVYTALSVLSDMGYHCEITSNEDPVILADYLATA